MKIAHVTLYPPKGKKHISSSGVASYSKNLVTHIGDQAEQVVVCDAIRGKQEVYEENGVTVHRIFERKPGFVVKVHQELNKIRPDVVHIQQELALFGGVITAYLLQWLVFLWRKKAVVTIHGVVDPILIDKTFVKENNSRLPVWLVKLAFYVIYTPLMTWAHRIIVHEQQFKDIAVNSYGIDADKIVVIPHGIEMFEAMDVREARDALMLPHDKEVALFMGYATGYKGIDLLIEGFAEYAKNHPNAYLIIGAGEHPKLKNDAAYLREYARLQTKASELLDPHQYRWEGFIKEVEIPVYYSASDVSLYPYTTALSSSGPMSFAIGYEKPFLVSTAFGSVFKQYSQLLFEKTPAKMAKRLDYFFSHRSEYNVVSRELKQARSWQRVSSRTLQVYNDSGDQEGVYETEKSPTAG
ncbi:MAG TPA: glycosyltransferase [Candidatus Saccharimonadales bacterium]|nr:glycosyltransferase [Candidatus Saccharimonadales bacterium]